MKGKKKKEIARCPKCGAPMQSWLGGTRCNIFYCNAKISNLLIEDYLIKGISYTDRATCSG